MVAGSKNPSVFLHCLDKNLVFVVLVKGELEKDIVLFRLVCRGIIEYLHLSHIPHPKLPQREITERKKQSEYKKEYMQ
jgi:hypothetical protein